MFLKAESEMALPFSLVRPAGRSILEVKVLCRPGKGNYKLNGQGVFREGESGGNRRRNTDLRNRNHIRGGRVG